MCGIIGAVGQSTNSHLSYQLLTNLLLTSQVRGKHATGFYLIDENGNECWFKSPIPASMFVASSEWKSIANTKIKTIIAHTRYKTRGTEFNADNNHPHVSRSGNVAMVHNGSLYMSEKYRKDFHLNGETDSELILKIILEANNITNGIRNVFEKFGKTGDFACELIYRNPSTKKAVFYFFRDSGRPGKFIDLREQLGQYFFCSSSDIWQQAYNMLSDSQKKDLKYVKAKNIPAFKIWKISSEDLSLHKIDLKVPPKREKKPNQNLYRVLYPVSQIVYAGNNEKICKYEEDQKVYDAKKNFNSPSFGGI